MQVSDTRAAARRRPAVREREDIGIMSYEIPYEPADIIIHVPGKGIVLKEKSLIAIQKADNKVVAVGTEVERIAERDLGDIEVISPLRQGMIADYPAAEVMFSMLLMKALGKKRKIRILKPAVVVCMPKGITSVEEMAVKDAFSMAASEVLIADVPAEDFIRENCEKSPKLYQKYKVIIDIAKDDPERYVEERLRDILAYAAREKISSEKMCALLQKLGLRQVQDV